MLIHHFKNIQIRENSKKFCFSVLVLTNYNFHMFCFRYVCFTCKYIEFSFVYYPWFMDKEENDRDTDFYSKE